MRKVLLALTALCLLFVVSCATIAFDATNLAESAKLNTVGEKDYTVVKSFKVDDKAGWLLGIIPVNKPAGDRHPYFASILANQIKLAGGDAVINVRIRAQNNLLDYVISGVTLGFYFTRTVTVTGDVIKYK